MNPEETIQSAIEKLEGLGEETRSQGSWWRQKKPGALSGYWLRGIGDEVVGEVFWKSDAELIVVLHRTIDAQFGMLRGVLRVHQEVVGLDFDNEEVWPIPAWALKLAEAILGGEL